MLCAISLAALMLVPGCGGFMARRIVQAPNSYPRWLAPKAPVELAFGGNFLTNFPEQFIEVGPPTARLRYRVIEPMEFDLRITTTNWQEHGRPHFRFSIHANVPGETNAWTASPRGTVVLLHGYGISQFAMAPWAFRLAEDGWRSVLVDLRGHGKSTGDKIFFGVQEARDMGALLDEVKRTDEPTPPVAVIGESYGAALALRWKILDSRVGNVVAIAPYAVLSNAVVSICDEYADWFPRWLLKAGLKNLPRELHVNSSALDPVNYVASHPVNALFIAGSGDKVTPPSAVREVLEKAGPASRFIVVPGATHEALPYYFDELVPPVLEWLDDGPAGADKTGNAATSN